jgi:hypothetical protein
LSHRAEEIPHLKGPEEPEDSMAGTDPRVVEVRRRLAVREKGRIEKRFTQAEMKESGDAEAPPDSENYF